MQTAKHHVELVSQFCQLLFKAPLQAGNTSAGALSFILCRTMVYMEEYQTAHKRMEQTSSIEGFNTAHLTHLNGAFKLWIKLSKGDISAVCIG